MRKILQKNPKYLSSIHQNVIKRSISSSPTSIYTKQHYRLFNEIKSILQSESWESTLPVSDVPRKLNPHVIQLLLRENQVGLQLNVKSMPLLAISLCNSNLYGCVSLVIDAIISTGLSPISIWDSFVSCYSENFDSHSNLNPKVFEMIVDRFRVKGLLDEAGEILLRNNQFVPGSLFFNSFLKDLINVKKLELFWKVCEVILKRIGVFDVYVYTNMIKAHCMVGHVEDAKKVFLEMGVKGCNPSYVTYNVIIGCLCKSGQIDEAVEIKKSMIENGLVPNVLIYSTLINGFCIKQRYKEAKMTLKEMKDPNFVTYNALVNGFISNGDMEAALRVKDEMIGSCVGPNVVVYNTILHGLWKGHMMEKADEIMKEMDKFGVKPDSRTLSLLIEGYCKERRMIDAYKVFEVMKRVDMELNAKIYGVLIIGFCHTRDLEKAYALLQEARAPTKNLEVDDMAYEILLSNLSKESDCESTIRVFEMMKEERKKPNEFCYASVIGSLCKEKKMVEARSLIDEMIESGLKPNACIFGALIKGYCKLSDTKIANKYFYTMLGHGLVPNCDSYTALMEGNAKNGGIVNMNSIFRCVLSRKVFSDNFTYKVFLDALFKYRKLEELSRALVEFKNKGFALDVSLCNSVVLNLCKKGEVLEAWKLLEGTGFSSSIDTYNVLMKGCFKIGDKERAMDLFDEIKEKGLSPDYVTYGIMIIGFCKSKDLKTACELLDEMVEKGISVNSFLYNTLVECCYKIGDLEKAKELSHEMTKKGFTLTSGFDLLTSTHREPKRSEVLTVKDQEPYKGKKEKVVFFVNEKPWDLRSNKFSGLEMQ